MTDKKDTNARIRVSPDINDELDAWITEHPNDPNKRAIADQAIQQYLERHPIAGCFYTQLKTKCMQCGLHFVICTDRPALHTADTITCPECGQKDGAYLLWAEQIEGMICELVPGTTPLSLSS